MAAPEIKREDEASSGRTYVVIKVPDPETGGEADHVVAPRDSDGKLFVTEEGE